MSQIELGEDASPAPTETELAETQTGVAVSDSGVIKSRQLLGPTFQSVASARSTFVEPLRAAGNGTASRAHARRVGARYLVQLGLTTIPLILVDLALLTIAILVARGFVRYIGIGTGIDVSASFLPIAVGFVLIAVELGLYPGIRLGPVEEFRRLAVSATLIFGMWTAGVILLTGGLQNQPLFLSLAYVLEPGESVGVSRLCATTARQVPLVGLSHAGVRRRCGRRESLSILGCEQAARPAARRRDRRSE